MTYSEKIVNLSKEAERDLADIFEKIDSVSQRNTEKVLDSFRKNKVSEAYFAPTTGYGYGDVGRDAIEKIVSDIFSCDAALCRHSFASGTHALTVGLFALLRPGDIMLSATGLPYDTLLDVIGIDETGGQKKDGNGSLADFGVSYEQADLKDDRIDIKRVCTSLSEKKNRIRMVYFQRSRGYSSRRSLSVSDIRNAIKEIGAYVSREGIERPYFVVDNCYGEFVEEYEPCYSFPPEESADLIIGSLIKNPGGGLADSGAYLAGTKRCIELAGYRMNCPGVGAEAGASLGQNRNILRGFFLAPHVVAQALKTAHFAAYVFDALGYKVSPGPFEERADIIQTVECGSPESLINLCRGIQFSSPVDSHVTPEPWDMPGYDDKVIMAAGAFVGGSSIELSCDGPIRPPYTAFLQGGITYEAGKIGIMSAADYVIKGRL